MKYYGRASEVSGRIVGAFKAGSIPETLARVFIKRDGSPCNKWSWSNQLLVALAGSADARGFRQWKTVKRHVVKGAKAVYILIPLMGKRENEDGEEDSFLYGFKSAPVFRYEDTDGEELKDRAKDQAFIDTLPLIEVARSWGLTVQALNGEGAGYLGSYRGGKGIALGVENVATWAHELVHAAEYELGSLKHGGQDLHQEAVAQLGASTLLEMLGKDAESDRGFTWEYIKTYADRHGKDTVAVCQSVLNRVGKAINHILETADALSESPELVAAVA